jgi:hypothetical protein
MRAFAILSLLALVGCFVNPTDEETAQVTFSVAAPAASVSSKVQAQGSKYWDALGLFYLYKFPKYVRVAVEHADGYELASGTWPDPEQGIGTFGEGDQGEVEVNMEVPVGNGRRLRVIGFVQDMDQVLVFGEEREQRLDLAPGQSLDLNIDTALLPTGRADITIRCDQGNTGAFQPHRVFLIDIRAAVVFPPVELGQDDVTQSLKAEIPVPVGRYFWPRIIIKNAMTGQEQSVEVRNPTFRVTAPDETKAVSYVIPCGL